MGTKVGVVVVFCSGLCCYGLILTLSITLLQILKFRGGEICRWTCKVGRKEGDGR